MLSKFWYKFNTLGMWIFIIIAALIAVPLYFDHVRPPPLVTNVGSVLESGCTNNIYKAHPKVDCSVKIDWKDQGIQRHALKMGVIPGDQVKHICYYGAFGKKIESCQIKRL